MPKRTLTDAAIRRLKAPAKGQLDVFDQGYPGLCLRLSYGGTRTWMFFTRVGGRLVRHRLGTYPAMGVAAARDAWRKVREDVQSGKGLPSPARKRNSTEGGASLSRDAIESVIADWLKRDQSGNASFDEVKRIMMRDVLPTWRGRLITSLGRRDVIELLDAIVDEGKIAKARNVHAHLHRLFAWSVGRGIISANPMAELDKPGQAVERDRVLSDAEVATLWRAALALGWPFGPIVHLLLLTACRRAEIGGLRWDEIDADSTCLRLPAARTKNFEPRIVPLTPLAWRILMGGPRIADSPFVFTTTGDTPVSGWSKAKLMLDRECRFNDAWRLHDLRRTAATGLEALGIPLAVTEAVLGHVSGSKAGIVGVYQRHRYEREKREALARWSDHVLSLVAGSI